MGSASNQAPTRSRVAGQRPQRRDAAENRHRLLSAAALVFDEHGLDASVTLVAQEAGLGMGTLYRHFPTKDELIDALVHEVLGATITMARHALESPDGTGLEQFLEASGAYQAEHPGCVSRLWSGTDHQMVATARRLIGELLAEAQKHHRVRAELTNTDIALVMWSLRAILEYTRSHAPDTWRRHLDLLVAGMRPSAEDLAHRPLSRSVLDEILTRP